MIRIAVIGLVLTLAGCAGMPDAGQVCERIEPFRPLIRSAITAAEPLAALPFAVTRNISCADLEEVAKNIAATQH